MFDLYAPVPVHVPIPITTTTTPVIHRKIDSNVISNILAGTVTTTTTATEVVSDEEVVLNVNVVTKEDANSNLNGVDAAAVVVDDDIKKCEITPQIREFD